MIKTGNFIRMLVRPAVTLALVGGVIYAALSKNMDAAKEIGTYAGIVITFWFADRGQQNRPADSGDK